MRRATAILFCLVAASLAGCNSSAGTSGPSGPGPTGGSGLTATTGSLGTPGAVGTLPAACSILTAAEVEGIVGHPVVAGVADGEGSCKWERSDVHNISVALHLLTLPGTLKCQTGGTTPVDGLGVEAGWRYQQNIFTGSITACRSRQQAQVTLIGDGVTNTTTEDQLRADALQLMTLVLASF